MVNRLEPQFTSVDRVDEDLKRHMGENKLAATSSSPLRVSASIPSQHNYKFIVVGNSRVGKTSLTNRCIFDEFEDNQAPTRIC